MNNISMGDKEYMMDSLNLQKYITDHYNNYANECVDPNLKNEFLNLLKEEHAIQTQIFDEMSKRGWYQTKPATQDEITQALQKYQNA